MSSAVRDLHMPNASSQIGTPGHIATDPTCPQYHDKKPMQRQMFAVKVIDDRSETDQPDADKLSPH
jgi:hypothetical protein